MSNKPERPGMPDGVRRAFRLPWRGKAQTDRDIDDEVAFHVEMRIAALRAAGFSPEDARSEALRRFGDAEELRDYCQTIDAPHARRARASRWAEGWMQDVRFAIRQLRRTPAFTAIAVLTLALGIGANTAIFSVVQHVLLAPVPYRGGDRIVQILESVPAGNQAFVTPRAKLVSVWQARAHSVEQIVGYDPGEATFSDGPTPEAITSASVAADMLPFLGVRPVLGRNFVPSDTMAGATPVALLGYGIWQRRYAGRSDVLGRLIRLNGQSFVVVGVMPRGLHLPFGRGGASEPGIWMPLHLTSPYDRIQVMGRLRSGNSAHDATRELSAITATAPGLSGGGKYPGAALVSTRRDLLGDSYQRTLMMLFGAVGLVLLIACANVANLLLVRAGSREREFAVRAALGAGRGRLVRQVLTESVLLALAGCAAGLLLAWRGLQLIIALSPAELSDLAGVRLEPAVLAWSVAIAVVTGIIFGIAPALLATEHTIGESLKSSTRAASGSVSARRVRGTLIVGEIALSVVLLVGAGLLMRSFSALEHVDPGFDPHGLIGVSVEMPDQYFASSFARYAAVTQILDGVRRIPGVQSVTVASDMPPNDGAAFGDLEIAGRTIASSAQVSIMGFATGDENYFGVVGLPLREGRVFAPAVPPAAASDSAARPDQLMINQRFAKRFWPDGGAVGARMRLGDKGDWMTVVGVVGDAQLPGVMGEISDLRMYVPFSATTSQAEIIVRSTTPSAALSRELNAAIIRASPFIQVHKAQTAESIIAEAVAQPRFAMTLIGAFALLALILAVVGLYGVIAYSVSQRTREIGVRIALGAQPRDVVALVMRYGFTLVAAGITFGVVAAIAATRVIQSLLFGIGSTDILTFGIACALTALVTSLACYVPARRAALIDPLAALRAD